MNITRHHWTPDKDLQRSDCIAEDGLLCRRIARGYEVDSATGEVKLMPPYVAAQWECHCPRDNKWSVTRNEPFRNELERQFVDELIRLQNLA